jgi:hypothetical protein
MAAKVLCIQPFIGFKACFIEIVFCQKPRTGALFQQGNGGSRVLSIKAYNNSIPVIL